MLNALGDLLPACTIPTTGSCDTGQSQIQQMDSVFQSAPPAIQAQYQSSHDSIMSGYSATWYTGIDLIPFNSDCGTICNLGQQAVTLMGQIQVAMGQTPTNPITSGTPSLTNLIILAGVVYLGFVYAASHH